MLPTQWRDALDQSRIQGNDLHDECLDHEGVDLDVEVAVEIAGVDCGVVSIGQQKDLFGTAVKDLFAGWLNELPRRKKRSCHLLCASGRTMLFFIDGCGELYFVDSHSHKDSGPPIVSAPPSNGLSFDVAKFHLGEVKLELMQSAALPLFGMHKLRGGSGPCAGSS